MTAAVAYVLDSSPCECGPEDYVKLFLKKIQHRRAMVNQVLYGVSVLGGRDEQLLAFAVFFVWCEGVLPGRAAFARPVLRGVSARPPRSSSSTLSLPRWEVHRPVATAMRMGTATETPAGMRAAGERYAAGRLDSQGRDHRSIFPLPETCFAPQRLRRRRESPRVLLTKRQWWLCDEQKKAAALYTQAGDYQKTARFYYKKAEDTYYQANNWASYDDWRRARDQWDYFYSRKYTPFLHTHTYMYLSLRDGRLRVPPCSLLVYRVLRVAVEGCGGGGWGGLGRMVQCEDVPVRSREGEV
jgi:hypothetical protein